MGGAGGGLFSAAAETETTITRGVSYSDVWRDRYSWDRSMIFDSALRIWRVNPLARDLTRIYRIFVTDGIRWNWRMVAQRGPNGSIHRN